MDEQQSELEREPEEAPHEPNAVEDPAYYYDIVERHSRMIQVKMHFRRWIFHLILRLVYIPVLLATYIASNNRAGGKSFGHIVLADICLKAGVVFIRGLLLGIARKSKGGLDWHKRALPTSLVLVTLWNIALLVIFSLSIKDGKDDDNMLVAAVFVSIETILTTMMCLGFCCVFIMVLFTLPNNPQIRAIRERNRNRKFVISVVTQIKKLIADDFNFKHDVDEGGIGMEKMKREQDIIVLPGHQHHGMHYEGIAEWLSNDTRCPIGKEAITPESIKEAIKEKGNNQRPLANSEPINLERVHPDPVISQPNFEE